MDSFRIIMVFVVIFVIYVLDKCHYFENKIRKEEIGKLGERIVTNKLKELPNNFRVENNIRFGLWKCQIDHIVFCDDIKLAIVIETKMWGNNFKGNRNDEYWITSNNKHVRNPYKQNKYHCKIVRKYYKGYKTYNVVCFVGCKRIPHYSWCTNENGLLDMVNRIYNRYIIGV